MKQDIQREEISEAGNTVLKDYNKTVLPRVAPLLERTFEDVSQWTLHYAAQ